MSSGEIWRDVARCGGTWGDVGRCRTRARVEPVVEKGDALCGEGVHSPLLPYPVARGGLIRAAYGGGEGAGL